MAKHQPNHFHKSRSQPFIRYFRKIVLQIMRIQAQKNEHAAHFESSTNPTLYRKSNTQISSKLPNNKMSQTTANKHRMSYDHAIHYEPVCCDLRCLVYLIDRSVSVSFRPNICNSIQFVVSISDRVIYNKLNPLNHMCTEIYMCY